MRFKILTIFFCIIFGSKSFSQNLNEGQLENLITKIAEKSITARIDLKIYYLNLNDSDKSQCRVFLVNRITYLLDDEKQNEAIVLIDTYKDLVNEDDDKLYTLLYIKGKIEAGRKNYSILRQTIIDLSRIYEKQKSESIKQNIKNYLEELNSLYKLSNNYSFEQLNGQWVADNLNWHTGYQSVMLSKKANNRYKSQLSCSNKQSPDMILDMNYDEKMDSASASISKESFLFRDITVSYGSIFDILKDSKGMFSELVVPYGPDSLYIFWCSENLNKGGMRTAEVLRGVTSLASASISAELAQNNVYNLTEQLTGNIVSSLGEIGINAIISSIFQPSKKMYTLEARLIINNSQLMTGKLIYKFKKVTGEGKDSTIIRLVKWHPNSKILFYDDYERKLIINPNLEYNKKEHKAIQKVLKKDKSTRFAFSKNRYRAYNHQQYKWLEIYDDSLLQSEGHESILTSHKKGVGMDIIDLDYNSVFEFSKKEKKRIESTGGNGVFVQTLKDNEASQEAGFEQGDIITEINGSVIKNTQDYNNILSSIKIGEWMNVKIIRGKKEMIIPVRMTWEGE